MAVSLERGGRHDPPFVVQITSESELGTLPALPAGTLAERRAPGGEVWCFVCVGRPSAVVRSILGWSQENVWLRQTELDHMATKRPNLIVDVPRAIAHVLLRPLSVHHNPQDVGTTYFIADGDSLRSVGLLQSRRVRFLDLVIELRPVLEGTFLRVVHFSPAGRSFGGRQLWP